MAAANRQMPSLEGAREAMAEGEREQAYWDAHAGQMRADHPDQFVAVKDEKVIAAEADLPRLISILSAKGVDIGDTWVRYIWTEHSKFVL